MYFDDLGLSRFVVLHRTHATVPVVVGDVIWPTGHDEQAADEIACVVFENVPAAQLVHFFVDLSLYLPATHALHVEAHTGLAVRPSASLAWLLTTQRMHEDEFATLPVPMGHA